jgi:hypothetical protein
MPVTKPPRPHPVNSMKVTKLTEAKLKPAPWKQRTLAKVQVTMANGRSFAAVVWISLNPDGVPCIRVDDLSQPTGNEKSIKLKSKGNPVF